MSDPMNLMDTRMGDIVRGVPHPADRPVGTLTGPAADDCPDWSTRPWGRPSVHPTFSDNPNLVATCDFRYHGLKVRGVRVFRGPSFGGRPGDNLSVNMPQKKFGDSIQNCVYFINPDERDLFTADVLWIIRQVFPRLVGPA